MPARLFSVGVASLSISPPFDDMTMSTELSRIELTGLGGESPGQPESAATGHLRSGAVWLPAALIVGLAAWAGLSGYASKPAESETVGMVAVVAPDPAPASAATPGVVAYDPPVADGEAIAPEEAAPVDGLKISRSTGGGADWGRTRSSPSRCATTTATRSRTSRSPAPSAVGTEAI